MRERYHPSQDAIDTAARVQRDFGWHLSPRGSGALDLHERIWDEEAQSAEERAAADAFVVGLVSNDDPGRPPLSPGEIRIVFAAFSTQQAEASQPTPTLRETWGAAQRRIRWIRESNTLLDSRDLVSALTRYQQAAHAIEDALPPELRPLPF